MRISQIARRLLAAMMPVTLLGLALHPAAMAQTAPAVCTVKPEDTQRIADTVRAMYKAAMAGDVAGVKARFTPDGYLFDNGERFTPESIMAEIAGLNAQGMKFVWTVTEPDVHLDCTTGWIAYVNKGSVETAKGKQDLQWLESADLKKQNGEWLIQFFHSTRVPAAAK
jgi:hypothetical protein